MIFQLAQRLLARPADEDHLRAWCVVLRHHTGGDCAAMSANDDLAEQTAQPFERDTAWPQEHWRRARQVENRRLDANLRWPGIEQQIDPPGEVGEHMLGG